MFPIPWNFPFRKKNGDVTTISDVIGGSGGSELPAHTVADAGKVLTVSNANSLLWGVVPSSKNLIPDYKGLSYGFVSEGDWVGWETGKTNYVSLFPVSTNKVYLINKADERGNRCRVAFFANKTKNDFMPSIEEPSTGTIFDGVNITNTSSNANTFVLATTNASGIIAVLTSTESVASDCTCIELCNA